MIQEVDIEVIRGGETLKQHFMMGLRDPKADGNGARPDSSNLCLPTTSALRWKYDLIRTTNISATARISNRTSNTNLTSSHSHNNTKKQMLMTSPYRSTSPKPAGRTASPRTATSTPSTRSPSTRLARYVPSPHRPTPTSQFADSNLL
jgi:hypothetical protein